MIPHLTGKATLPNRREWCTDKVDWPPQSPANCVWTSLMKTRNALTGIAFKSFKKKHYRVQSAKARRPIKLPPAVQSHRMKNSRRPINLLLSVQLLRMASHQAQSVRATASGAGRSSGRTTSRSQHLHHMTSGRKLAMPRLADGCTVFIDLLCFFRFVFVLPRFMLTSVLFRIAPGGFLVCILDLRHATGNVQRSSRFRAAFSRV